MRIVSRLTMVLAGIIAIALGIYVLAGWVVFLIESAGQSSFENTLFGASAEMIVIYTTVAVGIGAVMGGLLFVGPIRMGRLFRAGNYTTPDRAVIPKAYLSGGWAIIVVALASGLARWLFTDPTYWYLLILAVAVATGIIGLVNGYALKAANRGSSSSANGASAN